MTSGWGDWTQGELRAHWGSAYDIFRDGRVWTARRRDGQGEVTADSADALLLAIRSDYQAAPVPRDLLQA